MQEESQQIFGGGGSDKVRPFRRNRRMSFASRDKSQSAAIRDGLEKCPIANFRFFNSQSASSDACQIGIAGRTGPGLGSGDDQTGPQAWPQRVSKQNPNQSKHPGPARASARSRAPAPGEPPSGGDSAPCPRRRWLVRLAVLILSPVLFLALAELGLRLGGWGYSTAFSNP